MSIHPSKVLTKPPHLGKGEATSQHQRAKKHITPFICVYTGLLAIAFIRPVLLYYRMNTYVPFFE